VTLPEPAVLPSQAASDSQLLELWLHDRSTHTQRAYRKDVESFLAAVGKPLSQITLRDLQAFYDSLTTADSSRRRTMAAVKSLLTFGQRTGYLMFNIGAALQIRGRKNGLAKRILDQVAVVRMIALEQNARNRALLLLLYDSGIRASEVIGLTWADVQERDNGTAQITVEGKGGKTRTILIGPRAFSAIRALPRPGPATPVFTSRTGRRLDQSMVWRIVRAAAKQAGIEAAVSTHWLRHACASHALDNGAPVHLVQQQLGHSGLTVTTQYCHARPGEGLFRYLNRS